MRIAELGHIVTGKTPPTTKTEYFGQDYPFLTPSDMTGQKRAKTTERYLSEAGAKLLHRNLLPKDSVAVSCIGWQMGKAIQISSPTLSNQQINTIIPDANVVVPDYLYYLMTTMREYLLSLGSSSGVRTPILSKSAFGNLVVSLPDLFTQRRIASILSAYDDLIENNTRRIAILEEMARRIYEEWFVRFRFPGHDNSAGQPNWTAESRPEGVSAMDGANQQVQMMGSELGLIPEGWSIKSLNDFGRVITGKTPTKTNPDNFGNDIPFIKTPDMHGNIFCISTGEGLSAKGALSQRNKTIPPDSLFVSCIGTAGVVSITTKPSQTNQQINAIVLHQKKHREFLYFALVGLRETINLYGANGATMVNLNKSKFENLKVVTGDQQTIESFHAMTNPLFDLIKTLQHKNSNLRTTRDLLLPKLISGEIDVSSVPEPATEQKKL